MVQKQKYKRGNVVTQKKTGKLTKKRTSLKWIVKNWGEIQKSGTSSDTILFLFNEVGFESSYLQNGEFGTLYSDWYGWFHIIDHIMIAKDESEAMAIFKPEAPEDIKRKTLALFKKIRAIIP